MATAAKDVTRADTRVAYEDLREWIAALEDAGQLSRVTSEVDWKYELGAVLRKTWDSHGDASPALLFETIKNYPPPGPSRQDSKSS